MVAGQSIYEKMTLGLSNSGGAYLIKYDKVGNVVWKSNYGDNKAAIFNDVISVNNSIYVVGRDASRIGLINQYDMNGNLIKSSGYEYTDSLGLTSLVAVDDGIVATGAKKYVDDKNNSIVDALLIKYDFECNYLDEVTYDNNGVENPDEARSQLATVATLSFRDTNDNLLMSSDVLTAGGAKVSQDSSGNPAVLLSVKDKDKFYNVTKKVSEQTNKSIVIWLDYNELTDSYANEGSKCGTSESNCLSAATVSQGFASDVIIQGSFTQDEVQNLVDLINSGSLRVIYKNV